jgi:hypothetical protein
LYAAELIKSAPAGWQGKKMIGLNPPRHDPGGRTGTAYTALFIESPPACTLVSEKQGVRMGKIQELYSTQVRPMLPAERLQLARLILDDLAPTAEQAVDISDEWTDDDMADVASASVALDSK